MALRIALVSLLLGIVFPMFAAAQSVGDIRWQIEALLAQVAALQKQLAELSAATPPSITPTVTPTQSYSGYCPSITRSLRLGMIGSDVSSLQIFLAQDPAIYSDKDVTGFFGVKTEDAPPPPHPPHGIVSSGAPDTTGYGQVGPRTRSLIAANCTFGSARTPTPELGCPIAPPPASYCSSGWQANTDANGCTTSYRCSIPLPDPVSCPIYQRPICASGEQLVSNGTDANGCSLGYRCSSTSSGAPVISGISGPTTLAVGETGTWTVNASDPAGGTLSYSIDWGDAANYAVPLASSMSLEQFVQTTTFTHAYSYASTFTVTVTVRNASGQTARTTTTVLVGVGTPSVPFSASPTSGAAPLTVNFSATLSNLVGNYSIDFGDGQNATPQVQCWDGGYGSVGCSLSATHTYASPGTYTAVLDYTPPCPADKLCRLVLQKIGSVTITVSGGTPSASFRVVTPNGGETLTAGQPYTIRWNADGSSLGGYGSNAVTLLLIPLTSRYRDERQLQIANVKASDLSYTWMPPASLAGDSYRINAKLTDGTCVPIGPLPYKGPVCMAISTVLATDESDGWFSVK